MSQAMRALLEPIVSRIRLMIAHVVIDSINDTQGLQTAQFEALAGEAHTGVERFQDYGLSSWPHRGSEGLALFFAGDRGHGALVAIDDRERRFKLDAEGEVALYASAGQVIHLKEDGSISITAPGGISIDTASLNVTGDITGLSDTQPLSLSQIRATFNAHTHSGNGSGPPQGAPL